MERISLKTISTRELLAARRSVRWDSEYDVDRVKAGGFTKRAFVASRPVKGGECQGVSATIDELLAELETRPHLPGRSEGKLLRRLMAQTGWTADQLRAHPKFGEQLADNQHPNRRVISKSEARRVQPAVGARFGSMFKVKP